jgi:hypothetical protein
MNILKAFFVHISNFLTILTINYRLPTTAYRPMVEVRLSHISLYAYRQSNRASHQGETRN